MGGGKHSKGIGTIGHSAASRYSKEGLIESIYDNNLIGLLSLSFSISLLRFSFVFT